MVSVRSILLIRRTRAGYPTTLKGKKYREHHRLDCDVARNMYSIGWSGTWRP